MESNNVLNLLYYVHFVNRVKDCVSKFFVLIDNYNTNKTRPITFNKNYTFPFTLFI